MLSRVKRVVKATSFSMAGLRTAIRKEKAVQDELLILVPVIVLGLVLGDGGVEKALLIGSWLVVIIAELLNSAIEAVTDRVGTEWNELAGQAKDMGSAAVFVALCLAGLVWLLVIFG